MSAIGGARPRSSKKKAQGYYTPHSEYDLQVKKARTRDAMELANGLAERMQRRGVAFGTSVNVHLRKLAEDAPPPPEALGSPPPKIKPTVLKFRVLSRAAVTAELEISLGLYERAVGFLDKGDTVQAKLIAETTTGRQRILDTRSWSVKGVPGKGWISLSSVTGRRLLEPILSQHMPDPTIRCEPERWEGSATRIGVGFEYDPTFLPPAQRRKPPPQGSLYAGAENPPVRELGKTPVAENRAGPQGLAGWRKDGRNEALAATIRHLFTDVGLRPERQRLERQEAVVRWRPPPDVLLAVAQHRAEPERVLGPKKGSGNSSNASPYYRETESFLDSDYLAFIKQRYPDQKLRPNLSAERSAERFPNEAGVGRMPWEGRREALDPRHGVKPRRQPHVPDAMDRFASALSHDVLHGLEGTPTAQQLQDFLCLRRDAAIELLRRLEPPAEPPVPPPDPDIVRTELGSALVHAEGHAPQLPRRGEALAKLGVPHRGGARMYSRDQKRFSKEYARKIVARKTIAHRGALARQREAMQRGGAYFGGRAEVRSEVEAAAMAQRPAKIEWNDHDWALARAAAPESWTLDDRDRVPVQVPLQDRKEPAPEPLLELLGDRPTPEAQLRAERRRAERNERDRRRAGELREELKPMGLAILMKQALSEGVSAESVEATQETDEPKSQVVELLVQARMAAEAKLALPEEVEPEPDVEALFARPDQPRSSSSYDAAAVEREAVAVVAAERVVDREEEVAQQAVATLETERAIAAALAAQRAEEMLRELDVARSGEMSEVERLARAEQQIQELAMLQARMASMEVQDQTELARMYGYGGLEDIQERLSEASSWGSRPQTPASRPGTPDPMGNRTPLGFPKSPRRTPHALRGRASPVTSTHDGGELGGGVIGQLIGGDFLLNEDDMGRMVKEWVGEGGDGVRSRSPPQFESRPPSIPELEDVAAWKDRKQRRDSGGSGSSTNGTAAVESVEAVRPSDSAGVAVDGEQGASSDAIVVGSDTGWVPGCRFRVLRLTPVRLAFDDVDNANVEAIGSLAVNSVHTAIDVKYDDPLEERYKSSTREARRLNKRQLAVRLYAKGLSIKGVQDTLRKRLLAALEKEHAYQRQEMPPDWRPRVLCQIRHSVVGWCHAFTSNRAQMLELVSPDDPDGNLPPPLPIRDRPSRFVTSEGRLAAARLPPPPQLPATVPPLRIETGSLEQLEPLKRLLRAAAAESRDKSWAAMFKRFDFDRSGLLSRREFYRCVRRYVSSADMTDNDVAQLCRMVDGDGSGEISIDEFEAFLNSGPDMEREIQSITRIQARIRGKQARDLMSYRRHAKELREKADDQADLIKRRMRSIAYMRGGYDWRALFHQLDEDGSSMLCLGEFRRAVRQMHMTQQQVSDRELEILFKRMDNDGSGEIDAPEFEAFLGQGPSAEAELRGCVTIQSRNRGRRVRRAHYTAQIEQRWVDVGRDDWKFEKLTDSRYCLWPTLCAALTPKLLPERGHQEVAKLIGTCALVLSSAERALWLAGMLQTRQKLKCTVIHRKLDRAERKAAIERHLDEAHTLDERGRRALLVLSDLPNREWRELRLGKLGVQLLINVDAPTTGDRFLLRLGLLQRCGRSAHSRGVAVHMCAGAEQVERLEWLGELIAAGTSGAARPIKATASLPDEATALFMERRAERQAKAGCVGIQQELERKRSSDSWPEEAMEASAACEAEAHIALKAARWSEGVGKLHEALVALKWGNEENKFKDAGNVIATALWMGKARVGGPDTGEGAEV